MTRSQRRRLKNARRSDKPKTTAWEDMVRTTAAEVQQEKRAAVQPVPQAATEPAADPPSPATDPAPRPVVPRRAARKRRKAPAPEPVRIPHWTEEYCQWRQRTAEDDAEDAEEEAAQRALDDDPLGLYRD